MSDMWQAADGDPRDYAPTKGERATVLAYLRNYRLTFALKCEGLDSEQLARRSVPPSTLSLLGLLRHLAQMEHHWSRRVLRGEEIPRLYRTPEDNAGDFTGAVAEAEVVDDAWSTWRQVIADADAIYDADLDWDRLLGEDAEHEVRDVMVHIVEEYARHCGHADLLRECIDGRTGQ